MEFQNINFSNLMTENEDLQPLNQLLTSIMDIPEESLNENTVDVLAGMIKGSFTESVREQAINATVQNFREEGYTKSEVNSITESLKNEFSELISSLHPSAYKEQLLKDIFNIFIEIFEEARTRFGFYDIVLPIKLEDGAQMPTYAHDTDAAADLYAADAVTIPAHSISNMVRTGVHIALPQGWMAMIFPRSSIGLNTGLRLSNSAGIIDSEYRGALGVLYDNVSDSDYTINAGDRIAQLMIFPSYRFNPQTVDILPVSERGENGFGSSGK